MAVNSTAAKIVNTCTFGLSTVTCAPKLYMLKWAEHHKQLSTVLHHYCWFSCDVISLQTNYWLLPFLLHMYNFTRMLNISPKPPLQDLDTKSASAREKDCCCRVDKWPKPNRKTWVYLKMASWPWSQLPTSQKVFG